MEILWMKNMLCVKPRRSPARRPSRIPRVLHHLEFSKTGNTFKGANTFPTTRASDAATWVKRKGSARFFSGSDRSGQWWDNIVAALESEHSNRISEIDTRMSDLGWERFAAAMQKPFPELTHLQAWMYDVARVLPDSFLGGSAPRLRSLTLRNIPFPSIPKLLLSAHGLVRLTLLDIPDSGYFSPDAMATALTAMTRLETLHLLFRFPRSLPNPASRPLPPSTRSVLPALTKLTFKGAYEYLEVLLARIDAPRLYELDIMFFMALDFDIPRLHRLIGHAEEFKTFHRATVWIYDRDIQLVLYPNTVEVGDGRRLNLEIECRESDHQFLSLCQVCSFFFPLISALEELKIRGKSLSHWKDDVRDAQWLELLHPFTALKNLYLTDGIAQHFCSALQAISGKRTTEVLPALRNIFVQGSSLEPVQEAIRTFVAARRLSRHPVVVNHWQD
ncbi:hypothetical protein BC827DRAFT_1157363 [Russula dissimulans]|nr:hypothetical protein BC827DRAFT_1157363 [Russula dissimulans]